MLRKAQGLAHDHTVKCYRVPDEPSGQLQTPISFYKTILVSSARVLTMTSGSSLVTYLFDKGPCDQDQTNL